MHAFLLLLNAERRFPHFLLKQASPFMSHKFDAPCLIIVETTDLKLSAEPRICGVTTIIRMLVHRSGYNS